MEPLERHMIYFLGIGGIGMSALARYFHMLGREVAGYDRTPTELTKQLESEGIRVHYEDAIDRIPEHVITGRDRTLIVFTPAIPANHKELNFLLAHEYILLKRSEVLGMIFNRSKGIAIAGTHGKTTVTTMVSHLLVDAGLPAMAFLGGISKNYHSNLILGKGHEYIIAEADEFDRSFLRLMPWFAVITSADADHLDIYGTHEEVKKSFAAFAGQVESGGTLLLKKGVSLPLGPLQCNVYSYSSTDKADYYAVNNRYEAGMNCFDLVTPKGTINGFRLVLPGRANIENAVAALATALMLGVPAEKLKHSLEMFQGVVRRFDIQLNNGRQVYIDDYAHHPEELRAIISAAKDMFPGKKVTGIFQPHLFTRTRDFSDGFAESLGMLDELVLLEIYPARELPIQGVTSQMILDKVKLEKKTLCAKDKIIDWIRHHRVEVLLTLGAGDIDTLVNPISEELKKLTEQHT